MLNSVWAETARIPAFPPLEGDTRTDVLIVGGGMAGLLCAYLLKQAGVDCLLVEAGRICGGISRNTTAKLTSQHGLCYDKLLKSLGAEKARLYWQANEAALAQYRQLGREIPCGLETRDAYVYTLDSPEKLRRELEALERLGIPADLVQDLPLPFRTAGAVRFRNQAQFHPLKFAAGIAESLNIRERTTALEFAPGTVKTDRGTVRAEAVIMATHFPILNKHGGYFLRLYQSRSYVLALENAQDVNGMYLDEREGGLSLRTYEGRMLLGGGGHRTGKQGDGWKGLESFVRTHYPEADIVCRWAAQDCMSLDGVPYIGPYSRATPGLYVATGFNKWGMTSSMVAAMVLRDLVQGRENPFAPVFSPARSSLHPQLAVNALASAANLLKPTAPRCPHLGCALNWNPEERSWDCPCHGSRFAEDGKLLDGPATGGIFTKNL